MVKTSKQKVNLNFAMCKRNEHLKYSIPLASGSNIQLKIRISTCLIIFRLKFEFYTVLLPDTNGIEYFKC